MPSSAEGKQKLRQTTILEAVSQAAMVTEAIQGTRAPENVPPIRQLEEVSSR